MLLALFSALLVITIGVCSFENERYKLSTRVRGLAEKDWNFYYRLITEEVNRKWRFYSEEDRTILIQHIDNFHYIYTQIPSQKKMHRRYFTWDYDLLNEGFNPKLETVYNSAMEFLVLLEVKYEVHS